MEEYLECIICYDEIDKNIGDYICDICDTCKYHVHIACHEKYIIFNNRLHNTNKYDTYCLMCRKFNIKYSNISNSLNVNLEQNNHNLEQNNHIVIRTISSQRLCALIVVLLILIIIIIYIVNTFIVK